MAALFGLGIGGCFAWVGDRWLLCLGWGYVGALFGLGIGGCCVWVGDRWVLCLG